MRYTVKIVIPLTAGYFLFVNFLAHIEAAIGCLTAVCKYLHSIIAIVFRRHQTFDLVR